MTTSSPASTKRSPWSPANTDRGVLGHRGFLCATIVASALLCCPANAQKKTGIKYTRAGVWSRCATTSLPTIKETRAVARLRKELAEQLRAAVKRKSTPSVALLVLHRGKALFRGTAGSSKPGTIYDLASVTKVVATATAVAQLLGRGVALRLPACRVCMPTRACSPGPSYAGTVAAPRHRSASRAHAPAP